MVEKTNEWGGGVKKYHSNIMYFFSNTLKVYTSILYYNNNI